MIERWRKPVRPLAIKDEEGWASAELGRATLDYSLRLSADDTERVRLGYVCIRCLEPHPDSFPENCSVCKYPMRGHQTQDYERLYKGTERDPRAQTIREGLERVDDTHERNFHVHKPGIIVPVNL